MSLPSPSQVDDPIEPAPVLVEQRAGVRWIRLNRPHKRNAITPALIAGLNQAMSEALTDEQTSAVVVAGVGPSFCAGADLEHVLGIAMAGEDPRAFLSDVAACFTGIERAGKPVVAAVHGHVVAGGLELALACDAVIAASGTVIGDGHVRNGLLPGGGASHRLPRKVGEPLARRLILTGELLPAAAFLPSGFVQEVVPARDLDQIVTATAAMLGAAGPGTVGRAKRLLSRWHEPSTDAAQVRELDVFTEHWHSSDIIGGLRRFLRRNQEG